MAQYSTCDQVLTAYNPLRTMLGTSTTDITTSDVTSFYIPNADSYMDAFLAKKYVLPISGTPLLTMLSCDISIYKILQDRAPRIPDFIVDRWVAANSILGMLRDGDMILTGSNIVVTSGGDQFAWSNVQSYPNGPVFKPVETRTWWVCSPGWGNGRIG